MTAAPAPEDGRRARGRRSRERLLARAAAVASRDGLDGLSVGGLGADVGLSKSGVAGLYGSKLELQLATVAHACEVFVREVVVPVMAHPAGPDRISVLVGSWLSYVRRGVFPGGCFLQHCLGEQAPRPGPVRDALLAARRDWLALIAREIAAGRPAVDAEQVAFEIEAFLAAGNRGHVLGDPVALDRARDACVARLGELVRR